MTNATSNQTRRPPWMPAGTVQIGVVISIAAVVITAGGAGINVVRAIDRDVSGNGTKIAQVDGRAMENTRGVTVNRRLIEEQRRRTDDIAVKQGAVIERFNSVDDRFNGVEGDLDDLRDGQQQILNILRPPVGPYPPVSGR